jgi:hypothetical protein
MRPFPYSGQPVRHKIDPFHGPDANELSRLFFLDTQAAIWATQLRAFLIQSFDQLIAIASQIVSWLFRQSFDGPIAAMKLQSTP